MAANVAESSPCTLDVIIEVASNICWRRYCNHCLLIQEKTSAAIVADTARKVTTRPRLSLARLPPRVQFSSQTNPNAPKPVNTAPLTVKDTMCGVLPPSRLANGDCGS